MPRARKSTSTSWLRRHPDPSLAAVALLPGMLSHETGSGGLVGERPSPAQPSSFPLSCPSWTSPALHLFLLSDAKGRSAPPPLLHCYPCFSLFHFSVLSRGTFSYYFILPVGLMGCSGASGAVVGVCDVSCYHSALGP